jgi:CHAT domain-containing protein/Tfp pilus assembly protein PilF
VQGTGEVPAALPELGVRYLLTGQVRLQGQEVQVTVELLDRATGHRLPGTLTVDLPRLEALRLGFIELLAHAGLPVPESHKPKMLWPEDLSLTAFTLVGQGRYAYVAAFYDGERVVFHPEQFTEALQRAPHSYLVLNNLGWVVCIQQRYAEAVQLFEQALAINPAGVDAADGMIQSGIDTGNEALAETWTAHKASMQERDVQRLLAQMWDQRGMKLYRNSDYPGAIGAWEQALTMWREVKARAEEGIILSNLGLAYWALNQYERAISYYEPALAIMREVKNRAGEGTILTNLGGASWALSQYERALGYYEQALAIVREVKNRADEGATLNNLGGAHRALSQYERAISYFEQALAIVREVKNRAGEGTTLNNLGEASLALRQDERAIGYFEQALVLHREIKNRAMESTTLNNLGGAYGALRQDERAISYLEQALAIHREVKDRANEGATLNNLGGAYGALRQYEWAIGYHEQALAIHREVKDRNGEGSALNNLGVVYGALRQDERAIDYFEQALALAREVKNRAEEGTTLNNLMIVWEARQVPRLAIFYGKQAVNVYQAIRGDIQTLDKALQQSFLTSKTRTYRILADLLITEGRLPEAQQVLDLLKAEEYLDFIRRDAQAAGGLQQATLTPEESEWAQRDRTIADQMTALGVERRALLAKPSLTAEEEARLVALEHDLSVARQAFQQFLSRLKEAFRSTPEGSARFAEVPQALTLSSDLADLGPGTVALYTLVGDTAYRVILITPDATVAREYPITAADLNRKVRALREALRTPGVDPQPLAHELYRILVAPVAHDLQGAQAQTLMWSLDGVLRYLPMAALHDSEAYLVERYRHVMFTSASKARLKDATQTTWKGLGLGVSQAHGDFAALPGVVEELQAIIRDEDQPAFTGVLPGTAKLDAAFTAEAMRRVLRQRYPVVHIASHFHFRPGNETASFLLLGDGSHLPLSEIRTSTNVFEGVDLLTLSACETAMGNTAGDGTEVDGFGLLAQEQGAKAVVATLWQVADASTKALMQELYRQRETQPGLPKIEALRQAQLALLHGQKPVGDVIAQGKRGLIASVAERSDSSASVLPRFPWEPWAPYAHPFYWAPFILIGNWK